MKKILPVFAILISLTTFSCNKEKDPTTGPLVGLLMDHCGGVPVANATLELWREAVDKPGVLNDLPAELLETITSDLDGVIHLSEYTPGFTMSLRYALPSSAVVYLAHGKLDEATGLDLGTFYTEGNETDVILTWTNDSIWSNLDNLTYLFESGSEMGFSPVTLYSTSGTIVDTVENIPLFTKMFDPADLEVNLKWQLGIRSEAFVDSGYNYQVHYQYFDACPAGYQSIQVATYH